MCVCVCHYFVFVHYFRPVLRKHSNTTAVVFVGQLLDAGFRIIDALDPASEMLDEAKKKNIYRNFYNCFMTGDPLDIPAGCLFCLH